MRAARQFELRLAQRADFGASDEGFDPEGALASTSFNLPAANVTVRGVLDGAAPQQTEAPSGPARQEN